VKIKLNVDINFSEEDVKQLILDKIAEYDSRIVVDKLDIGQRRNPSRLGIDIVAHMGDGPANNVVVASNIEELTAPTAGEEGPQLDLGLPETDMESAGDPQEAETKQPEEAVTEEEATTKEVAADIPEPDSQPVTSSTRLFNKSK